MLLEPSQGRAHPLRSCLERDVMHAANAAHGALRPLFREIEEPQLVAAAHIEKDVGGGWLVAILDNLLAGAWE